MELSNVISEGSTAICWPNRSVQSLNHRPACLGAGGMWCLFLSLTIYWHL
jgi:hypothetical protein